MDSNKIRLYGALGTTFVTTLLLAVITFLAYWTDDRTAEQLVTGATVAQFTAVVQYWVGSSSSSQQKDEALQKKDEALVKATTNGKT